jgi:hypothetical protein
MAVTVLICKSALFLVLRIHEMYVYFFMITFVPCHTYSGNVPHDMMYCNTVMTDNLYHGNTRCCVTVA